MEQTRLWETDGCGGDPRQQHKIFYSPCYLSLLSMMMILEVFAYPSSTIALFVFRRNHHHRGAVAWTSDETNRIVHDDGEYCCPCNRWSLMMIQCHHLYHHYPYQWRNSLHHHLPSSVSSQRVGRPEAKIFHVSLRDDTACCWNECCFLLMSFLGLK